MTSASLITGLQSNALAQEIEQQLKQETSAVIAAAEADAATLVTQARASARARVHDAIAELRREGETRLARAHAQLEAELRAREQQQAARAVADAMPLLRDALRARWQQADARKQWIAAIAKLAAHRLPRGAWQVAQPPDCGDPERKAFTDALGRSDGISFTADDKLRAGLRISADQATLDATPDGLLADNRTIAALLLDELTKGATA